MGIIKTNFNKLDGVVLRVLFVVILTSVPVLLLLLPAAYFDKGESICISRVLFDQECYGCGITRAVQHMLHGEVRTAFALHPASVVVTPIGIVLWFKYWILNLRAARTYFQVNPSTTHNRHHI
jgi:hypothetical protein